MHEFDVDLWRDASASLALPKYILHRSDRSADEMLATLDTAAVGADPDSLFAALFRYLVLEKQYLSYHRKIQDDDAFGDDVERSYTDTDDVKELRDNMDDLFDRFTALSTLSMSMSWSPAQLLPNLYFLPNVSDSIPFPAMVSEMLANILRWKKEISKMWRMCIHLQVNGKILVLGRSMDKCEK